MREITDKVELRKYKYALFMILHVETSTNYAHKFNSYIREVYEELGSGNKLLKQGQLFIQEQLRTLFSDNIISILPEI